MDHSGVSSAQMTSSRLLDIPWLRFPIDVIVILVLHRTAPSKWLLDPNESRGLVETSSIEDERVTEFEKLARWLRR